MPKTNSYSEKELPASIAAGDTFAFRQLFDIYYDTIYCAAFKWTKEKEISKDIVQDIFVKLWINRQALATVENLKVYLLVITKNHVFNTFKKKVRAETFLKEIDNNAKISSSGTAEQVDFKETNALLQKAIEQLPPQQKKVFTLGKLEGYKLKDIAGQMSISIVTVNKHMALAVKSVRDFLMRNDRLEIAIIALLLSIL